MSVNKVVIDEKTVLDLTEDTVNENTLLAGSSAHNAEGKKITGAVVGVPIDADLSEKSENPVQNKAITKKISEVEKQIGSISSASPGDIMITAGSTPPVGWCICDGQELLREQFSELFSAIGTTYGEGNGTTTFNVPDLRDNGIALHYIIYTGTNLIKNHHITVYNAEKLLELTTFESTSKTAKISLTTQLDGKDINSTNFSALEGTNFTNSIVVSPCPAGYHTFKLNEIDSRWMNINANLYTGTHTWYRVYFYSVINNVSTALRNVTGAYTIYRDSISIPAQAEYAVRFYSTEGSTGCYLVGMTFEYDVWEEAV